MDDRVGPGERVLRLAEVGQVGDQALPERAPVVPDVDVQDVVAVLTQLADDPRPALAAPAGDDDPHPRDLLAPSMPKPGDARDDGPFRSVSHARLRTPSQPAS